MQSGGPRVSYILVNWNTEDFLPRALRSIAAQTHSDYEILLVNNASGGFSAADYAGYAKLTIIENSRNRGFATANNQAIRESSGEVIVLVNCDAYLDPAFTERALEVFAANERIGMVVPKILRDDGSQRIDSAGHIMYRDRTAAHRGAGELDQGQYDAPGFVFGGTAAVIAYRREMVDEIAYKGSLFDDSFFAYYEDVDVDWRAQNVGWLAFYEPRCKAWHHLHGSGGSKSWRIRMIAEKNRYLMIIKNDYVLSRLQSLWPLFVYETWHFFKTLMQPWLWPGYLLYYWHAPGAILKRFAAGRSIDHSSTDAGEYFYSRGHHPPLVPARPDGKVLDWPEPITTEEDSEPLVSIIVVNYNGIELTKRCIKSLQQQSFGNTEIIAVDNGSEADEAHLLSMQFDDIRTLRLERNGGFSGGVNWGCSIARGQYIALVNNDAVLDADCIGNMVEALQESDTAAVSGRLINIADIDDAQAVLAAARGESDAHSQPQHLKDALAESEQDHALSLWGYIVTDGMAGTGESFYPSGGLCMLRRDNVRDLIPQLFPHSYFMYHEDVALGFRLQGNGQRIVKESSAFAAHAEGSSSQLLARIKLRFYQERNRRLNLIGFVPMGVRWRLLPMTLLIDLLARLKMLFTDPAGLLASLAAEWVIWLDLLSQSRWTDGLEAARSVDAKDVLSKLSGQVRGRGGLLNRMALAWCRLVRVPHLEQVQGEAKAQSES